MILGTIELRTPLGGMRAAYTEAGICCLAFTDTWARHETELGRRFGKVTLAPASDQWSLEARLASYYDGHRGGLRDIPIEPGGTEFRRRVWELVRAIPSGQTATYGHLAESLGQPGAARAVGAANGANPLALLIPCHRVVAAGGRLGGYSGGLARKRWLLEHEGTHGTRQGKQVNRKARERGWHARGGSWPMTAKALPAFLLSCFPWWNSCQNRAGFG